MPTVPPDLPHSLESFLRMVWGNNDITGLRLGEAHQKISAYGDDILFILSNPVISLPNLMREFDRYQKFSNVLINFQESEALPLKIPGEIKTARPIETI